jgi:3D (Asp-Asp-Asp) domain-containing protein
VSPSPKAGDAYITFHPDFGPLNREMRAGSATFGRNLRQMEAGTSRLGGAQDRLVRKQRDFRTSVASTGRSIARYAVASTAIFGTASAFGKVVSELEEANKVSRQTTAVLRSTGGAANVTAGEVGKLADKVSLKAAIDDDAIQSAANLLLTFTNVRNEVGRNNDIFNQAIPVITDMSVALGKDLNGTAIQVGKALQDPIKGITALRRVGVNFNQEQQDRIKQWVEEGDLMRAQKFILRELNTEFAGSAAAQATGLDRLRVRIDQLAENTGKAFEPQIDAAVASFDRFIQDIDRVVSDPRLSQDEKISRVTDVIAGRIEAGIPVVAGAVGRAAPKIVEAFVRGFVAAPAWGKIAIGAWLVSKTIGWGTIFRAAGARGVGAFASTFLPGMGASGASGGAAAAAGAGASTPAHAAAGGRAGAAWGGAYRVAVVGSATTSTTAAAAASAAGGALPGAGKRAGGRWARAFRIAALAGVAFIGFEIGRKIAEEINDVTGGGLSSSKREAAAKQLSDRGYTDIRFSGRDRIYATTPGGRRVGFKVKQRGGMIDGTGDGDKVPVLAEPGEGFINKRAVKALGGPPAIDAINRAFPRFQRGGVVGEEVERQLRRADPGGGARVPSNRFLSTAYGPPWGGIQGTGKTSTGVELRPARQLFIVAVDPRVIPYHSRLAIHPNPFRRSGEFQAEDTGGAIKGQRLDFYDWRGRGPQMQWGERWVTVRRRGRGGEIPRPSKDGDRGGGGDDARTIKVRQERPSGYTYPLSRKGSIIGTPHKGTHNLGNWPSDNAIDVAIPFGTGVRAVADGTVTKTGGSGNFSGRFGGYNLTLRTAGNEFFYTHLSRVGKRGGVDYGETIGRSGKANGVDHLHFGMRSGSPLKLAGRTSTNIQDSDKAVQIHGVGVKGEVTFQSLLDALGQKLESRLAEAKLTPSKRDDLRAQKKLLAYWRGKLKLARRRKDYQGITEAANAVGDYREQIRTTRKAIRDHQQGEQPEPVLFELGGLRQIGKGQAAVNIGGLQGTLDKIELDAARAALTTPAESDDSAPGLESSLQDDIAAASRLVSVWGDLKQLADGMDFSGRWVEGTVAQKTEAATQLKSARDALDSFREEIRQAKDSEREAAAERDTERAEAVAELRGQRLEDVQGQLRALSAQLPVFERFANAPRYHDGGVVPGPPSREVPIIARGGEVIGYQGEQQPIHFTVLVEDDAVDRDKIKVVAGEAVGEMVRKARSGGPAPGVRWKVPA